MEKNFNLAYNIIKNWSSYILGFPIPIPVGYVIIGTTFLCNARCMMCDIHKFYGDTPALNNKEMGLSKIFMRLKESKIIKAINHIDLTGGEPFLKKDLKDFIIELFGLPNIHLITINTNGLLVNKIMDDVNAILETLKNKKRFSVSVSLDGVGETHDKIRGVTGAFAKVDNTVNGLKKLRDKYPNFAMCSNAVIQHENIDALSQIKAYWENHNIAGAFSVIQNPFYTHRVRSAYNCISRYSREDIEKMKSIEPKSTGMNYYLDNYCTRPLHCFAGYSSMFLDPFGNVYPCNFLSGKSDYLMGNAKDTKIDNIWKSQTASDIRSKIKACPYTTCWNGCEVDQTMIQFEPLNRLIKTISFGSLSFYKIKGLNGFE
jgi:radical SAM protein with 4Fe4S-binding SPASM domain